MPAPVIETFNVSLTATSACDAPVDEISAVLVCKDAASNLLAPVMINPKNNRGKQVILLNQEYPVRQPLNLLPKVRQAEAVVRFTKVGPRGHDVEVQVP